MIAVREHRPRLGERGLLYRPCDAVDIVLHLLADLDPSISGLGCGGRCERDEPACNKGGIATSIAA